MQRPSRMDMDGHFFDISESGTHTHTPHTRPWLHSNWVFNSFSQHEHGDHGRSEFYNFHLHLVADCVWSIGSSPVQKTCAELIKTDQNCTKWSTLSALTCNNPKRERECVCVPKSSCSDDIAWYCPRLLCSWSGFQPQYWPNQTLITIFQNMELLWISGWPLWLIPAAASRLEQELCVKGPPSLWLKQNEQMVRRCNLPCSSPLEPK